jgi:hypothetical protein
MPLFSYYANVICNRITGGGNLEKVNGLDSQTLDKINTSIESRKPAYLAVLLVDTLKESGWTAEDIHFLGVEIINESGML